MLTIAVRHCSPLGRWNSRPSPRTVAAASATNGIPPDSEKRPVTGVRPDAKTAARDNSAPAPLLVKYPAALTPLAWLRRKPAWRPYTCSNRSVNRAGVSVPGVNQPAEERNPPTHAALTPPIAASRPSAARRVNAAPDKAPDDASPPSSPNASSSLNYPQANSEQLRFSNSRPHSTLAAWA